MLDLAALYREFKRSRSPVRQTGSEVIGQLNALLQTPDPKIQALLAEWQEMFQNCYGDVNANLSSNRKLETAALLAQFGVAPAAEPEQPYQLQLLFFAIQTYFTLLLKLTARYALNSPERGGADLLLGRFAAEAGIENYCGFDFYCWPLLLPEEVFAPLLRRVTHSLAPYDTGSSAAPPYDRDCIQQIYHALIPKPLRHALGEFYTPDWLAQLTWQQALALHGAADLPTLRVLDPTCGSGSFLVACISAKRRAGASLAQILDSAAGIDINPLAVLTAKTNYLLSVLELLTPGQPVHLPVLQGDVLHLGSDTPPRADLLVGNPPWVNWEYLPEAYRAGSQHLWQDYGLFRSSGKRTRFIKEDISVLITCRAADQLLRTGGTLAFVIRQGVFKSAQNAAGFRRFQLPDGVGLRVLQVDDFSKLRVFDHAAGSAALLFARKGAHTVYPLPYICWEKRDAQQRSAIKPHSTLEEVRALTRQRRQQATPARPQDMTSPWVTAEGPKLDTFSAVLGQNHYKARTGVFTGGANAVYWLHITGRDGAKLQVQNITRRAKRQVPCVRAALEPDYLFPLILGRDLEQWRVSYSAYLLCPHTAQSRLWPVPGTQLARECPATFSYLSGFRAELDSRKGFASWEKEIQRAEFHAVLKVGPYTFSKYKVAWRYIASRFLCAVIAPVDDPWLGQTLPLPNEKIMYISTDCADEAYYLCALLSSTPVAQCVQSYMNPTSISAHVLDKLALPDFDPETLEHLQLAQLCRAGHRAGTTQPYLEQIDAIVRRLYHLAGDEP